MSSGLMTLSYMAELSVAVNIGYLGLESLRYLGVSKSEINQVSLKLDDIQTNGKQLINLELFSPLYVQVKNIFHKDYCERIGAWYVESEDNKKIRFKFVAVFVYGIFKNNRDEKASQIFLVLSALIIILLTCINQLINQQIITELELSVWWGIFILLLAFTAIPAIMIFCGRYMFKVIRRVALDVSKRKDRLAENEIIRIITETNEKISQLSMPPSANG